MARQLVLGVLLSLLPLSTAFAANGEVWEQTMEMGYQGMPMKTTHTTCMPKGDWAEPPKQRDECRATDVKRSGNSMTWKMVCEDGSTGDGQVTRTGDTMAGRVRMNVKRDNVGEVTMNFTGRRTGGTCDPDAQRAAVQAQVDQSRRQLEQIQAQQADLMKQQCREGAKALDVHILTIAQCASEKPAFCAALQTAQGYAKVMSYRESDRAQAFQACGKTETAVREDACAAESKKVQPVTSDETREALQFLSKYCTAQATALAQRECAGRSFTGRNVPADWVYPFCVSYASKMMGQTRAEPVPAQEKKPAESDDPMEKAKKAAKGLFKF